MLSKVKISKRWYLFGRTPRRFLWCWSSFYYCYSSFVDMFHSHFLSGIIPHPSVDYRQVFRPILYFQPSSWQSDSLHFYFQPFRYLLKASATVLSGHFLPTSVFYLTLLPDIFGTISFYQGFNGSWQLLSWKLQGFILILETQTRSFCLFDSQ